LIDCQDPTPKVSTEAVNLLQPQPIPGVDQREAARPDDDQPKVFVYTAVISLTDAKF